MKVRLNQILAGVLGLQLILGVLVFWPRTVRAELETVFAGLEAAAVENILIEDDTGAVVQLARRGKDWVLPLADDYPVQVLEVERLLGDLLSITIGETVTTSAASQGALQVADDNFLRKIILTDSSGTDYVVYLGSSPRFGAVHFRLGGRNETHLAVDLDVNRFNARASDWIDAIYLRVNQEDLIGLDLQNLQGRFIFSRDDEGAWLFDGLMPGEVQNDAELNSLLGRTTAVNMTEPISRTENPAWGLDDPLAVLVYDTVDGPVTLVVGAQNPDDLSYVVKSSASDYYVRVRESSVQMLVDAARETYVQQPTLAPTVDPALLPSPTEEGGEPALDAETETATDAAEPDVETGEETPEPLETPAGD
jgi:hypothetical protein